MFLVVNPPQISRFELIQMNVVPKSSRKNASKLPKLNYIIDNVTMFAIACQLITLKSIGAVNSS